MIRLSHSLLNAYEWGERRGDLDEVIETYLRIPKVFDTETQKRIDLGVKFDLYVEEYVKDNTQLPPEIGGLKLKSNKGKKYFRVKYNDRFDLSGEVDIDDSPTIIEIKTSIYKQANELIDNGQVPFYFLMAGLDKKKVDRGILYRFNPVTHEYDRAIMHNNKVIRQKAIDRIELYGPKIEQLLKEEGII